MIKAIDPKKAEGAPAGMQKQAIRAGRLLGRVSIPGATISAVCILPKGHRLG